MAGMSPGSPKQNRQPPPPAPQTLPPSAPALRAAPSTAPTAGGALLAVVPFGRGLAADLGPVAPFERAAHRVGDVGDAGEAAADAFVAVDVALGHVPVVDAGVARRVGVGQREPLLQLLRADVNRHTADAVDAQLDRRDSAVVGRAIVLRAGRHGGALALGR